MPCREREMCSYQWLSFYFVRLILSPRILCSGGSSGPEPLQWTWIKAHWVSTTDLQHELCLARSYWFGERGKQCVTHHSLCFQAPNSLKARNMETDVKRRGMKQKHILFIYSYNQLCVLFKMNNNSLQFEGWILIPPTTNAPSALPHKRQKTMFDDDPWHPCAALNYLGSNGSYILSFHI